MVSMSVQLSLFRWSVGRVLNDHVEDDLTVFE